ncbi:hypothetical protein QLH52_14465 [Methylomonas sp. OY6]|uniref:DUF4760 domain-containing protein n=1 Tax=Methylomonas defluvii TaxID=3045149 RepID=A0ABU4UGH9_9GAMM|nr:hypothetical protein [Methylomonas sp. OY6]MDX8128493.1 hypothetical protein [Methylomonas sp. OY6]
MTCSADQKSYYDWALVLVPIFISGAVALIGFFQYRINNHKFRLDLYNRRFSVYEKALVYFQSYYSSDTNAEFIDACARDFIRVYRESIFLFGADSAVYRELTALKDTLGFLVQFDRKFKTEPRDQDEYKEWSKRKQSKPDLHTIMAALENALLPWLDFKKIGK